MNLQSVPRWLTAPWKFIGIFGVLVFVLASIRSGNASIPVLFHPIIYVPDPTALIMVNLEPNDALFAYSFYDENGWVVYSSNAESIDPGIPKKINIQDLPGLAVGFYSMVVSSDRKTQSLVMVQRQYKTEDNLGFYQGGGEPSLEAILTPVYKGVNGAYSTIYIQNSSAGVVSSTVYFYDMVGSAVTQASVSNLPPNATGMINTEDILNLPPGYTGWAKIEASGNIYVVVENYSDQNYEFDEPISYNPPTGDSLTLVDHYALPRLFKAYDEGAGSRTSRIALMNPGDTEATLAITYTNSVNETFPVPTITLASKEMKLINLAEETDLNGEEVYSAIVASNIPVGISEFTYYDAGTPQPTASYLYPPAYEHHLPRIIQQDGDYSAFSIQNTGSTIATGSVIYFRLDGTSAGQTNFAIPTEGFVRLNTLDISQLGSDFEGGAIIASNEPVAVQVDEYVVTPNPVPTISSLSPSIINAGSPGITLTVNGTNFIEGSTIQWNGSPITTTYKSASQLQASIPASNLINPQIVTITVKNPPPGGGTSNSRTLTITNKIFVFMPISLQGWPPRAETPSLDPINNADQDNKYTVSWKNPSVGATYILEEAWNPEFTNAGVVYQGTSLSWTVPTGGKLPGTYYYRVKAKNPYTESGWSVTQSITIYPLYVGLKGRWDGKGFLYIDDYYEPGTHETFHCDALTDADTIRCKFTLWYDPDPIGWGAESWNSYYSVKTGGFKSTDAIGDPAWKWGYSWKLSYNSWFNSGETVRIDGQKFTVTGPHDGYTTYGQPIKYWQFVNQEKFILQDLGDDLIAYIYPGEATLRYDAGSSGLLVYDDINRHYYYQGEDLGIYGHYISNLSAATSLPGSPPVPMLSSDLPLLGQPALLERNSVEEGLKAGVPRD